MVPTPKMEYQVFLCMFQKRLAMATLGLKEMGKCLWEGREKSLPVGCLSLVLLNFANRADLFPYLPKGIFPFPSNLR